MAPVGGWYQGQLVQNSAEMTSIELEQLGIFRSVLWRRNVVREIVSSFIFIITFHFLHSVSFLFLVFIVIQIVLCRLFASFCLRIYYD